MGSRQLTIFPRARQSARLHRSPRCGSAAQHTAEVAIALCRHEQLVFERIECAAEIKTALAEEAVSLQRSPWLVRWGHDSHGGRMRELREHFVTEPEMYSDAYLLRRFIDFLEVPVKRCSSVGGSTAGQFLLRGREQSEEVWLFCRRCPPFLEGAVDPENIAASVFVKPARMCAVLRAVERPDRKFEQVPGAPATRDESLSRSSAYARFKARYSENICEHKQPKS
jgi:hypothetical protein